MGWVSLLRISTKGCATNTVLRKTTNLILDRNHLIVAVLAGQPDNWDGVAEEAFRAMEEAREKMVFLCPSCKGKPWRAWCERCVNRRGDYKSASVGLSYGGGQGVCLFPFSRRVLTLSQQAPCFLSAKHESNVKPLRTLTDNKAIKRIAGFGNSRFCALFFAEDISKA